MAVELTAEEERRLFERFSARFPARFKDTRDDFGLNIQLNDASALGIRITTRDRLFINDSVSIEVELPGSSSPMVMNGEVKWVKNRPDNTWDVGIKFFKVDLVYISRLYKFVEENTPPSH